MMPQGPAARRRPALLTTPSEGARAWAFARLRFRFRFRQSSDGHLGEALCRGLQRGSGGGPGRTRTCNRIVMSGPLYS